MTARAKIELPNFKADFDKNILREIKSVINKAMPSIVNKIKSRLKVEFIRLVKDSEEYQALVAGDLRGELGLPDPTVVDRIIDAWADGIQVVFTNRGKLGVIEIGMIQADYADVLSLPDASYVYASRDGNTVIEWLRWLLLESTSVIVVDYEFAASNRGRTGLGIMVNRSGGGWRVPAQYAGTANDNFVTRALADIERSIDVIVRQEITKGI